MLRQFSAFKTIMELSSASTMQGYGKVAYYATPTCEAKVRSLAETGFWKKSTYIKTPDSANVSIRPKTIPPIQPDPQELLELLGLLGVGVGVVALEAAVAVAERDDIPVKDPPVSMRAADCVAIAVARVVGSLAINTFDGATVEVEEIVVVNVTLVPRRLPSRVHLLFGGGSARVHLFRGRTCKGTS